MYNKELINRNVRAYQNNPRNDTFSKLQKSCDPMINIILKRRYPDYVQLYDDMRTEIYLAIFKAVPKCKDDFTSYLWSKIHFVLADYMRYNHALLPSNICKVLSNNKTLEENADAVMSEIRTNITEAINIVNMHNPSSRISLSDLQDYKYGYIPHEYSDIDNDAFLRDKLSEKQYTYVSKVIIDQINQSDLGKELGVTFMAVCRGYKYGLKVLKKAIENEN